MIWVMYATAKQSAKVVSALENVVPDAKMKERLPITEMTNGRTGFQRLECLGIDAVTGADGGGVSSCIAPLVLHLPSGAQGIVLQIPNFSWLTSPVMCPCLLSAFQLPVKRNQQEDSIAKVPKS
jgi:hypothetical protein